MKAKKQKRRFTLKDILPKYTLGDIIESEGVLERKMARIYKKLEQLEIHVGRKLTKKERDDVLDIVHEYTPRDSEGYYLVPIIPFERAWQIYRLTKWKLEKEKKISRK